MEQEELMIGDWIHCPKLVDKVEGDDGNCQVKQLHVADLDVYSFKELRYDEIEPIPITPEILEKNGFVLHKKASYFKQYMWTTGGIDNYADIYIEVVQDQQDNWRWDHLKIKMNFCGGNLLFFSRRYVHELQHALRLCKIDKKIEL